MIDLAKGLDPFVVFVGAGASAMPPSNLPTWIQFNDLLLTSLLERLAEYSHGRQRTQEMLSVFQARRDKTEFFAPDFQAQLVEEEIGADYFRVWQSLKTDLYGPVHASLAELAAEGRLAAVVTTNFDRLIETALKQRGQRFQVFHDKKSFDTLLSADLSKQAPLRVIKIHGSIEDTTSLIDTLKQRVAGRPESLMKALNLLLRRFNWLYVGFSGADFSYDKHYLGIFDAAAEAKGFVFLAHAGKKVQDGVRTLKKAYGAKKAAIVKGDLSNWLSNTFHLPPPNLPSTPASGESDSRALTKARIQEWVSSLGSMAVVNILCSMLRSSGMEAQAYWLLRRTWKSYRSSEDTQGPSYARYNYNLGMSLLDAGFISNPVSLAEDKSNLLEWRDHANQNAFEYFARSYKSGKLLAAGARLASVLAYRGEVGRAIALTSSVTDEGLASNARLELCDIALASAVVYDIVQLFQGPAVQLAQCIAIAKEIGDEPRRAALCAHQARFLIYLKLFEEADAAICEADSIARRLDLRAVLLASNTVRGLWLAESGASTEKGMVLLKEVVAAIHAQDNIPLVTKIDLARPDDAPALIKGRNPALCRVLLDLNGAAQIAGDVEVMNQTLDELDELLTTETQAFVGYYPHYCLSYAQCLLLFGAEGDARERAKELIQRARSVGEESGNPWVAQFAAHLEQQIPRGQ